MSSNNDMILEITREFEKVISKIITSREGIRIINILKQNIDTVEYNKTHLIDDNGVKEIESKLTNDLLSGMDNFSRTLSGSENNDDLFTKFIDII